jgi:methylase of polypeptide subunit release factors
MRKMKDRFSLGQIWEIGCGSGIIAVEAGRLGAIQICATDVDDEAVELTRRNGEAHGLRIQSVQADLFRGVPWKGPFDLLLSILPQKPCLPGMLPLANDGGPEGTKLLLPLIEEAPSWLKPSGELMIFIHSLAHPEAICRLHRRYDVTIISIKRRIFSRDEFSGLIDFWEERRNGNLCYFEEEQRDQFAFITMILKARPKR